MKSPVCLPGPRHRGLDGDLEAGGDRRRSRQARSAAEDGGRRLSCLARNGAPGVPAGLPVGWGARGRKLPDAVAASRSRRSRPSARSSHERSRGTHPRTVRETGGDRLRPPKRDTQARPTAPSQRGQPSAGPTGQRSGPLPPSLRCPSRQPRRGPPKRAAPCSTKRSRCHRLRSTLPWSGACAPDSLSWSLCATRSIRPAPLHPERGFARAAPASGIEPIRGETAQPVRAKPKSPARRATPKPALSGILGRVSSNDPGWPIAERQVSNDKRRQKPLAVGRLGAGLDPKLTFGRSAVRQRRWADGCSSARVQHDNQGEKRASIRMRNGLSA